MTNEKPREEGAVGYYMDQELFNYLVLVLVLVKFVGKNDAQAQAMTAECVQRYLDFYTDDNFLPEAEDCAERTFSWLHAQHGTDGGRTLLTALLNAARKYKPNGKRKIPWLFGGFWFQRKRPPIHNRSVQYFKDLGLYFINITFGKILS